jgi:hypothetical protein
VEQVRIRSRYLPQGDESTIYLWIVPAQARGVWRAGDWQLRIRQNFQEIEVEADVAGRAVAVPEARLEGNAIAFSGAGISFRGQVAPATIAGEFTQAGRTSAMSFAKVR